MSLFCDQTTIKLIGGKGGNGAVCFRKEKFVDRGGPNGGDGGRGGDIYLKVNHALNSLIHLHTLKQFRAENGEPGMKQNMHGKDALDLYLEVPQGTIIRKITRSSVSPSSKSKLFSFVIPSEAERGTEGAESRNPFFSKGRVKVSRIQVLKTTIADMSNKFDTILIARGGKGGFGNEHFKTSIRQAPKFAELGEDGQEIEIELELKLVADIGIIGIPSAGKSSLISVISNAKPKIAAYPFTTLIPHLGVVQIDEKVTYIVADIPGLIEGAHRGKGLGIEFLKHVQRCRLLVHLIDPSEVRTISTSPMANFHLINHELAAFSKDLARKLQIVVINKADLLETDEEKSLLRSLKKEMGKKKKFMLYPQAISCATRKNIPELKTFLFQQLQKLPVTLTSQAESRSLDSPAPRSEACASTGSPGMAGKPVIYRPHLSDPKFYTVKKVENHRFRITGQRIEQIANMTDMHNREAKNRLYHVLKKMKISKELRRYGAKDGDKIEIGKKSIEFFK